MMNQAKQSSKYISLSFFHLTKNQSFFYHSLLLFNLSSHYDPPFPSTLVQSLPVSVSFNSQGDDQCRKASICYVHTPHSDIFQSLHSGVISFFFLFSTPILNPSIPQWSYLTLLALFTFLLITFIPSLLPALFFFLFFHILQYSILPFCRESSSHSPSIVSLHLHHFHPFTPFCIVLFSLQYFNAQFCHFTGGHPLTFPALSSFTFINSILSLLPVLLLISYQFQPITTSALLYRLSRRYDKDVVCRELPADRRVEGSCVTHQRHHHQLHLHLHCLQVSPGGSAGGTRAVDSLILLFPESFTISKCNWNFFQVLCMYSFSCYFMKFLLFAFL